VDAKGLVLICARCGDRIGVYEPFWLHHPDGTLINTAVLPLRASGTEDVSGKPFHLGCLAPDALPHTGAAD
jgi:hypothetical protein